MYAGTRDTAKGEESWSPPLGVTSVTQPAGIGRDTMRVPAYLAARMLIRLGSGSGALIRGPYAHRDTWLVPPGVTLA
ncbi:hypothetical protein [Streptomyces sp. ODS28]|uniref:hypothetical protein n=1 Tax=Streptomyces sp. ODS28 TaxID=3136688 RepID=UPI0031E5B5E4